jgi:uncharacterized membrane protein YkvA (DUF1232 family)
MEIPFLDKLGDIPPIILFLIAVIYIISPIDAIPDVLPFIGWLDDFVFLLVSGIGIMKGLRKGKKEK